MCFGRLAVLSSVWQEEFEKNDSVKTLNGYWNALEQKWSLSWIISDSRDSVTQVADELTDIDGVHCLEC